MTDDKIKEVFEEYGRVPLGKEYALIHAIAEAVAPQRTWIGLTNEERKDTLQSVNTGFVVDASVVALAIEAKLKEKNNG